MSPPPSGYATEHMSRVQLDHDLEHTLEARSPGDHPMQVWSQSSHLCRSRSDLRKKFIDGQTDKRQTPRDCISSWNELKTARTDGSFRVYGEVR